MKELYYVTVWCRAMDSYEIEADSKEEAEKKALEIMKNQMPNAKNPLIRTESRSEMRERVELNRIGKELEDD